MELETNLVENKLLLISIIFNFENSQVAEMHGELMEFNERLHRLVSQKELTVRRLREELIDLRGPVSVLVYSNNFLP